MIFTMDELGPTERSEVIQGRIISIRSPKGLAILISKVVAAGSDLAKKSHQNHIIKKAPFGALSI